MMIEDEELRDIYKIASEEHLQKLEDGLLHLEKNPQDKAALEEVLREAHTLKGDSRMLGVNDVETLTHQLEDVLEAVKRDEISLSSQVGDRLYQGLDAIRKLVREAVTGESAGINVFYVLANLMGANAAASSKQNPEVTQTEESLFNESPTQAPPSFNVDPLFPDTTSASSPIKVDPLFPETAIAPPQGFNIDAPFPDTTSAPPQGFKVDALFPDIIQAAPERSNTDAPSPEPPASRRQDACATPASPSPPLPIPTPPETKEPAHQIDTIRVEPQKLDTLMTQAGELTVTKIRIAHRMTDIEEILTLWEDWSRDTFVSRLALDDIERGLHSSKSDRMSPAIAPSLDSGALKQVQKFQHLAEERLERLGTLVNKLKNTAYVDTARLEIVANELESGIRTLRLLPLSTIFNLFPRMVRDLAHQQSKQINLVIEGGDTRADKRILEEMKDPLMHMIRNAIDHGIETPQERESLGKPRTATVRLRGYQTASSIGIEIADDGRGLNIESIKRTALRRGIRSAEELAAMTTEQIQLLIFAPGFSTRTTITEISGRGVGLDVVRAQVERLKGTIQVDSTLGQGCKFRMHLDTTLATTHVLIVEVNKISYALPVEFVQTTLLVSPRNIFAIEGCQTIALDGQPVSVALLADLLELQPEAPSAPKVVGGAKMLPCIILQVGSERLGLLVDALLDQQDVVLKPQSKLLKRVRNISGATILGTGEVCMVLNPQDLLQSMRKRRGGNVQGAIEESLSKQTILLVEDSITIRTQVKRILEGAGYEVVAAVDGLDGFNKLKMRTFHAVVSDVQMPNMDGLSLTAKIRLHKEYSELPIILCTTLATDEDKKRGADAGANAYLTKGTFDQKILLDTLKRLV